MLNEGWEIQIYRFLAIFRIFLHLNYDLFCVEIRVRRMRILTSFVTSLQFALVLNGTVIPVTKKVPYVLHVYISSKTNCTDSSVALQKCFVSFNNIMSVLGNAKDEMLAVHLIKTYRLPTCCEPVRPGLYHLVINIKY